MFEETAGWSFDYREVVMNTMSDKHFLRDIEQYRDSGGPIPVHLVKSWMESTDIDVLGQVADLITYPPQWERIEPPLEEEDMEEFLLSYYRRCILEDPKSDLADSRYGIGSVILGWFDAVPREAEVADQRFLLRVKHLLSLLYVGGNQDVRDAIVCGALEHILEDTRWRTFFADWQEDSSLRSGYERALAWAVQHARD